jgi:hypothetical protein
MVSTPLPLKGINGDREENERKNMREREIGRERAEVVLLFIHASAESLYK